MEHVPHTGPLRDYAGANHTSCDSSIFLQLPLTWGGCVPAGSLQPRWSIGAGEAMRMRPDSFCICLTAILGFIEDFTALIL